MHEKILHPMASFGSVTGLTEGLRIDHLEERLNPAVPFPHKHDFHQILLVRSGQGEHEIDFVRYPVKKNSIFVMRPGEVHSWELGASTKGFVLEFPADTLVSKDVRLQKVNRILQKLPAHLICPPKVFEKLYGAIEDSHREFQRRFSDSQLVLLGQLIGFLIHLSRLIPTEQFGDDPSIEFIEAFQKNLETNFRTEHRVEFYASAIGLSSKALTMRFARLGLKSPREQIQDRCILEAKRMLVYSGETIQVIGERLGFEDPNYFARFFRTKTGQSPGAFREQSRRLC